MTERIWADRVVDLMMFTYPRLSSHLFETLGGERVLVVWGGTDSPSPPKNVKAKQHLAVWFVLLVIAFLAEIFLLRIAKTSTEESILNHDPYFPRTPH